MRAKRDVAYFIIMGDSLSDRGTMYNRLLLNFIRMSVHSGLKGKAAADSFTNGLPWSDHFIAAVANHLVIEELKKEKNVNSSNIGDVIITRRNKIYETFRKTFSLKDDVIVKYKEKILARTYIEGGLTAHNYSLTSHKKFCFSPTLMICRQILSTLEKKRRLLLMYDKVNQISDEQKTKTLVIEWSGSNDLLTVNTKPDKKNADYAINARIKNIKELIANGYRQFVLFNLPDISLSLRYQNKNEKERLNAKDVSNYFNQTLKHACDKLQQDNPDCLIDVFDVNAILSDMHNNPEKFKIDKNKINKAFLDTKDFTLKPNHTSPATGYMFWDEVHPTADVHAILAYRFYDRYQTKFNFVAPQESRKSCIRRSTFPFRSHLSL